MHPHLGTNPPLPVIRIDLLTSDRKLKLMATTRAVSSDQLTPSSILSTVFRYPFTLFLTMLRITYHAGILHYVKRLDVYPRPEPRPAKATAEEMEWSRNPVQVGHGVQSDQKQPGSGPVGWQPVGWIEGRAKERVCQVLSQRARELGVNIHLRPSNTHERPLDFPAHSKTVDANLDPRGKVETLTIKYLTPLFFTHVVALPSATHVLLLSSQTEKILWTSNDALFLRVLEPPPRTKKTIGQQLRLRYLPDKAKRIPVPPVHPLDSSRGMNVGVIIIVLAYYALERLERMVYLLFRARFVRGEEPWNGWERDRVTESVDGSDIGSVRRSSSEL